jgi:myo-inositol 2-dehydrogenase/D-chiro-inositol 1-dehydrogenase
MLKFGLLGAGRIGYTHAVAVNALSNASIQSVYDPVDEAASRIQELSGATRASVDEIMVDDDIDAVIIATPTNLHADQIEMAARAGKAIFCEKPIDLDTRRVRACLDVVEQAGARLMVGFNRRFDANFSKVRDQINQGAIGAVEMVQITSRDPSPPPVDYIKVSGGLFRDMMIHDFDMARFLLGEEISEVTATGSVLVDPAIGEAGDVDSAVATLRTASGKIAIISNSRRATYGYDQRVEVHGSKGLISAENMRTTTVSIANEQGYTSEPLMDFFMERYADAYKNELGYFVHTVLSGDNITPNGLDGLRSLELADAALISLQTGATVKIGQ